MNTTDRIVAALSPGSPFNANGLVWRSVTSLAQYAGVGVEEVLELLVGNLAADVAVKPSKKKDVGLLAALKVNLPGEHDADGPVVIAGGPVFNPPEGGQPENPAEVEVPAPPVAWVGDVLAGGIAGEVPAPGHAGLPGQVEVAGHPDVEIADGMDPDEPLMD